MPLKLKAGCYYRTRGGEIVGPMEKSDSIEFPWRINHVTYKNTGRLYGQFVQSQYDLIAEVPAPTKKQTREEAAIEARRNDPVFVKEHAEILRGSTKPKARRRKGRKAPKMPEVIRFLLGEVPLNGLWYGDSPVAGVPQFWWRKDLRALFTLPAPAGSKHG